MQPGLVTRRQFSVAAALALLGGATITIGCGGGSSSPSSPTVIPPPPQATGNIIGSVGANHPMPHIAVITAAQLGAGVGITLDISNGLHTHTVLLSSGQVQQIAARASVSVASSTDPHSDGTSPHLHMVTFN